MLSLQIRSTLLRLLVLALVLSLSAAWSSSRQKPLHNSAFRRKQPSSTAKKPSNPSGSSPQSPTSHEMLRNSWNPRVKNTENARTGTKLSHSVLASCDTLPAFPTAHGLLSPETVMRLQEMEDSSNKALSNFLKSYKQHGPLSCVPMLSDPDVLPHLTRAMRDIAL